MGRVGRRRSECDHSRASRSPHWKSAAAVTVRDALCRVCGLIRCRAVDTECRTGCLRSRFSIWLHSHQSRSGMEVPREKPPSVLMVFERGTDSRKPRSAARSSRPQPLGTCRPAGRPARQRSRFPPTSAARLHTADHRRFRQSRGRCSEQRGRAPAGRSRCRQIPDDRPAAARGRSLGEPPACRHKD
jgi:hypothetical protein